jgi:hypothetical protein
MAATSNSDPIIARTENVGSIWWYFTFLLAYCDQRRPNDRILVKFCEQINGLDFAENDRATVGPGRAWKWTAKSSIDDLRTAGALRAP